MRFADQDKWNTNSTVANRMLRRKFRCDRCPANKGENGHKQARSDRHKNHRRNNG